MCHRWVTSISDNDNELESGEPLLPGVDSSFFLPGVDTATAATAEVVAAAAVGACWEVVVVFVVFVDIVMSMTLG